MSTARRPSWRRISTIFRREVRDQVRDRRTLFMVFVLPLLLYPLLGIGVIQLATSFEQKPRKVVVVGAEHLPAAPPLLNPGRTRFEASLFPRPEDADRLEVEVEDARSPWLKPEAIREGIRGGLADAVVVIPPGVADRVGSAGSVPIPIQYDSTDEASQVTYLRVREVVQQWKDAIVQARLARDNKPSDYTSPVETVGTDVAPVGEAGGSIWGRLFPFLLVIMALTGAFYPSIDLCAGEKERGTMETLLLSPASRTEIVLGKFLTVVLASVVTALLNLVSMGLAGVQIASQVANLSGTSRSGARMAAVLSPPHPSSYFWMMLLLIPLAAMFSALCVALATLARSMKEGQYYMTPLYLVSMPLILVTMAPEIRLNAFYSLVPITGPSLLLKSLILGEYGVARTFFLPVMASTLVYAGLALGWAVDLFRREDVIFRESEVFDLRAWLWQVRRDREPRPGAALAILAFVLTISLAWFAMLAIQGLSGIRGTILIHLGVILGVPVALSWLLTTDPLGTLRLRRCRGSDLAIAAGLALCLNPSVRQLAYHADQLFPVPEAVKKVLASMTGELGNVWAMLAAFALMPAITEEFAFRGFILSGLSSRYRPWTAILLSSFLFGFLHVLLSLFTQLFGGFALGVVLGYLALKTGSLWPGVLFHFVNNALGVLVAQAASASRARPAGWLFSDPANGLFRAPIVAVGAVGAVVLFVLLARSRPGPVRAEPTSEPALEPAR